MYVTCAGAYVDSAFSSLWYSKMCRHLDGKKIIKKKNENKNKW